MPVIRFIMAPTAAQTCRLVDLYRSEGWWYADADPDADARRLSDIVRGSHCFAVAEIDGDIVGMGRAISDRASDAYIQDVAVAGDRRGQGIGTAIVDALVKRLESDGLSWIGLIAERHSEPFYTRLGFAPMLDATPLLKTTP